MTARTLTASRASRHIPHPAHAGVIGTNTGDGNGVLAQSATGVGLAAKGGRLAGFFDGNVDITGKLTVAGRQFASQEQITVLHQQVTGLQQQVANLNGRIDQLENQLATAVSNLTARVTSAEVSISGLAAISHTHS